MSYEVCICRYPVNFAGFKTVPHKWEFNAVQWPSINITYIYFCYFFLHFFFLSLIFNGHFKKFVGCGLGICCNAHAIETWLLWPKFWWFFIIVSGIFMLWGRVVARYWVAIVAKYYFLRLWKLMKCNWVGGM